MKFWKNKVYSGSFGSKWIREVLLVLKTFIYRCLKNPPRAHTESRDCPLLDKQGGQRGSEPPLPW